MTNAEQEEFWTSHAGPKWVTQQARMDAVLAPVLRLLMDRAPLKTGDRVLDIGCGTGVSLSAAAKVVGSNGHVTGLDISETMLDLASQRMKAHVNVSLLKADAQVHMFATSFDAMISRFGVMFFNDTIAALKNLGRALASGGTMTFAAWGPAPQNPYFMVPAKAATRVLGEMPKFDRTLPGPFAFEDSARVLDMMEQAGLTNPRVETVGLDLTPPGNATETADLFLDIGPAQRAVEYHEADEAMTAKVKQAVAEAITEFETPSGLRIPACIHIYTASKAA